MMIEISQASFKRVERVEPIRDGWVIHDEVFNKLAECDSPEKISFSYDFFDIKELAYGWVDTVELLDSIKDSDFIIGLSEKVVDSVLGHDAKLAHSWLCEWTEALTSRYRWKEWSRFLALLSNNTPCELDKVKLRIAEKKGSFQSIKKNFQLALEKGLPVEQLPRPDETSSVFYQSMVLELLYSNYPALHVGKEYTDRLYGSLRKEFYDNGLTISVHHGMGDSVPLMRRENRKAVRWQGTNALEVTLCQGDMREFKRVWAYTTPRAKEVVKSAASPMRCTEITFHNMYEAINVIYDGAPTLAALRRIMKSMTKRHRYYTHQHYNSILEREIPVTRNHISSLGRPDPEAIDFTCGLKKLAGEIAPHFKGSPKVYFTLGIIAGRLDIAEKGYKAAKFGDEERRQNISYAVKSENLDLLELLAPTESELRDLHHIDQVMFGYFLYHQTKNSELSKDEIKQFLGKIPEKKELKKGSLKQIFCTRLLLSYLSFSDILSVKTPFFNDMAIKGLK